MCEMCMEEIFFFLKFFEALISFSVSKIIFFGCNLLSEL